MIRWLALILCLVLGIAAALLWYGSLYHLRLALPGALPAWTSAVAPEATLPEGTARIDLAGTAALPPLHLHWTIRRPGPDGLHWAVRLTGDGIDAAGDLTIPYSFAAARLVLTGGTLDLARLAAMPVPVEGTARIEGGTLTVTAPFSAPRVQGDVTGLVPGLAIAGADFGAGPLRLEIAGDGGWTGTLDLTGGVSAAGITLTGAASEPRLAIYRIEVTDDGALPGALRGLLQAAGQPGGDGWILSGTAPLF